MATTIKEEESAPASYPTMPAEVSEEADALGSASIWQRIEAYTALRFTARAVVWFVEGCGEWVPPLRPATVTATEVWEGDAWVAFTPTPGPLGGYVFKGHGPYRITANDGGGTVPAVVEEAFIRLAEYFADVREASATRGTAGVSKSDFTIGQLSESWTRSQAWAAKAMELSGAGDLLRPYRRA